MKVLNVRIDDEVYEEIRRKSYERHVSMGTQVRDMLRVYLEGILEKKNNNATIVASKEVKGEISKNVSTLPSAPPDAEINLLDQVVDNPSPIKAVDSQLEETKEDWSLPTGLSKDFMTAKGRKRV